MSTHWLSISVAFLVTVGAGLGADENPPLPPPAELARQSGCLKCHRVGTKLVGPAWQDVAARYRKDEKGREKLIEVVSNGGKGNWTRVTRGVPMPPHSPRLSDEQISHLVDWILTLSPAKNR
jgi:cytochrome c